MDVYTTAIRSLAAEIASAKEDKAPHLLLRLKQNLQDTQKVSKEQRESAYRLIWRCDLLHVLVGVLRKDYSLVSGGWNMSTQLAELLTAVCSGLRLQREGPGKENTSKEPENQQVVEFYDKLLPAAVDSFLILANNILEHATLEGITAQSARTRSRYSRPTLHTFQSVLASLSRLCANHGECALKTAQSPLTLKMIATSHSQYSHAVVSTLNNIYTHQPLNWLASLPAHTIIDVLAYKMTISEKDKELQLECLKLLTTFIMPTSLDNTVTGLTAKYSTLPRTVLDIMEGRKDTMVTGDDVLREIFEQFLKRMKMMVVIPTSPKATENKKEDEVQISSVPLNTLTKAQPTSNAKTQTASVETQVASIDKESGSAIMIQPSWRDHATRTQLKDSARNREIVEPIQHEYAELKKNNVTQIEKEREKRDHQELVDNVDDCGMIEIESVEGELIMEKQLQSIKEMRTFHEKQLAILEQLPAGNVSNFLQNQKNRAAICIQKWWRRRQRRWKEVEKAAIVIQRTVRQFLKEKHYHNQPQSITRGYYSQVIEGEERDQLQAEIDKYQREHFPLQQSEAELRDSHNKVQHLLRDFYSDYTLKTVSTNNRDSIQTLITKIDHDCEVLLRAPRLNNDDGLSQIDDRFFTGGGSEALVVVRMAQQMHSEEMKASEILWEKKATVA